MTIGEITFAMLKEDFILWRCLHGGPLDQHNIERWSPDSTMPWAGFAGAQCAVVEEAHPGIWRLRRGGAGS